MPPPTTIQETPVSQMPQPNKTNSSEIETPTTNTTQLTIETPRPTMDLMIDDFPTLPTKRPTTNPSNATPSEEADFSDDSVDQSPVITMQQPIQITFKRPLESTSDSEEQATTKITKDQRNTVINVYRELHKYNFRDVGKLQNINMNKKKRIISKAMHIEFGDYDPSNEYIVNYSDAKTVRLYRKLTENKIDVEPLYQQIHNRLYKQDKLKRTRHST